MGDDIVDLAVLGRAGLSAAPADAVAEVRALVDYVAPSPGGGGAARDVLELVLRAQHAWEAVVAGYAGERSAVQP
jgi:3-deoxy-D-manno-octulosonate 8-phosphate phosphatase (KDO 8-P phosphatase)